MELFFQLIPPCHLGRCNGGCLSPKQKLVRTAMLRRASAMGRSSITAL